MVLFIYLDVRIFFIYNNIFMLLREIVVIQCAHRSQHHAVDAGSYNYAGRWISQRWFLCHFHKRNDYFEEILEACNLFSVLYIMN
jgi:hypothetical protein